jgi:hypothetical protein
MGDLMRFEKIELWIHCLIVREATTFARMQPWKDSARAAEMSHVHELIASCVRERLADEGSIVAAMGEIESHVDEQAALRARHVSLASAVAIVPKGEGLPAGTVLDPLLVLWFINEQYCLSSWVRVDSGCG